MAKGCSSPLSSFTPVCIKVTNTPAVTIKAMARTVWGDFSGNRSVFAAGQRFIRLCRNHCGDAPGYCAIGWPFDAVMCCLCLVGMCIDRQKLTKSDNVLSITFWQAVGSAPIGLFYVCMSGNGRICASCCSYLA